MGEPLRPVLAMETLTGEKKIRLGKHGAIHSRISSSKKSKKRCVEMKHFRECILSNSFFLVTGRAAFEGKGVSVKKKADTM